MTQHFKDLIAWQKAMDLVEQVYRLTEAFPARENYGLSNQLRRAAVSVASNIAEGQARYSKKDSRHFLRVAKGSLAEIETQALIARRLAYINQDSCERCIGHIKELGRILAGLISSIHVQEND
ncbi:MAG: four helix bundle protein [Terriglobales bacterium]